MGYLIIKLLEAKNLEAKDHSGTSDPIVTCKLISNDTQQSVAKAKSKVVKKTCNPQFNETLTLPVSNNPRGYSLHLVVQDWNRIGSKQPLGDCTVNLDDWKPHEEKELYLNLQNAASGIIHIHLTHKPDNKSKVLISYGSEALVEYNLLRSVKLNTQLDLLCQLFSTPNPCEQYTLQIKDNEQFITQEQLSDAKFEIPDNTVIRLMLRPNLQVDGVLQSLRAESSQKKAIFDLKNQLQDSAFAEAFIAKDGIKAITKLIMDTQGNTLAYALSALDSCMTFGMGWDTLSQQEIEKIVSLLDSQNLNVRSGALKVASHLASSKNFGYPLLNAAIKKLKNNLFAGLMSTFPTSDVLIQLSSLQFVNSMLHSAPTQEKQHLFELLEKEKMTQLLKDQVNTSDPELKSQIARYAKLKFELDKSPTPYDKENPEHEKMLMDLWTTLYPDQKLEARVCKQWKLLGFQGNDPATDFRGMGTLALKHLLYAAKTYTEDIRNMMQEQEENPDTYYPVAVAGINLSKMLYDIFRDAENDSELKYIPLLFDHEHSLDEIYCECLFFFDETWTEMEATYFNFSNVIAIVADRIVDTLSQCKKLQEFREKTTGSKGTDKNNKKTKEKKDKKKTTPFFKKLGGVMSPKPNEKNTNNKKTESIHTVVKEGNTKKASDLIREGANINELNESGLSALHVAVVNGNLDMVRLLLWKDAEVDIKNNAGWTPLHEAAKNSSLEICDVLLHKGANPSAETGDGITPFHYLVGRRFVDNNLHQEVMTDMLNKGVNINHSNNSNSETPLFYAVAKGLTDVVRFLISHGADPNPKNRRGYTVLHIAILQGEKAMVELLLQSGADVTIPAKEGTPTDLAKSNPQVLEAINNFLNNKGKPQNPTQQAANTKSTSKPLPVPGKKVLPPLPPNHPKARPASTKVPGQQGGNDNQVNCYHGAITREQAEALVVAQNKDCFLLRASSVRGCYAMTVYKPGALELTHFLVYPRNSGGFSIQDCDDTNTYANLNELITKSPVVKGCFPIPSSKPTQSQQPVTKIPSTSTLPQTDNIYGMAPSVNDALKQQMNDLYKLLETSLVDIEKPAEWSKTKVNLKKAATGLASLLN